MTPEELIDLESEESFPASDPPSWTLGVDEPSGSFVPAGSLFGPQTQRARENFAVSSRRLPPSLIRALGMIKACAARANGEAGALPSERAELIANAADRIARGEFHDQFVVDVFQTGSGTSTNMNANEVIATLCGAHPNDDVNRSQSSNDVFPSAIHVAAVLELEQRLLPAIDVLHEDLRQKEHEFRNVLKIGRTHLQDATPMRLGQEFGGYARQASQSKARIEQTLSGLHELPIGGTAIGTGINAPEGFGRRTAELLATATGQPFHEAANHFEAQAAKDAVLFLSGALKTYAVALMKIANDIRWLASGPDAGLGELFLPELQPGSSIMPGKTNPVIAESTLMACVEAIAHDTAITWACASGNFELNTMMPLIAYDLLDAIDLLTRATLNFAERCVRLVKPVEGAAARHVDPSVGLATVLAREIGYDRAAEIAKEARRRKAAVYDVALEQSGLPEEKLRQLLRFDGGTTRPL